MKKSPYHHSISLYSLHNKGSVYSSQIIFLKNYCETHTPSPKLKKENKLLERITLEGAQHEEDKCTCPQKKLAFLSIDLDTGNSTIEESSSFMKIETAPIGHYVHFCTMEKAIQLKKRFDKKPYLLEKFLNT